MVVSPRTPKEAPFNGKKGREWTWMAKKLAAAACVDVSIPGGSGRNERQAQRSSDDAWSIHQRQIDRFAGGRP